MELAESSAVDGQYGLKLTTSEKPAAGRRGELVEAAPLTIETPPVKIRSGQMVRIHGWVNVPQAMAGTSDGLRIVDSLGGEAMAERIPITDGWREFTLYRGVAAAGELTVKFEMTGIGTASVDEVTIRAIDLPTVGPRQAKRE